MSDIATAPTTFKRNDPVVYVGDDAHRGLVGKVTRVGLEVLDEPAVEVVFRWGRSSIRKFVRVSKLARFAEVQP